MDRTMLAAVVAYDAIREVVLDPFSGIERGAADRLERAAQGLVDAYGLPVDRPRETWGVGNPPDVVRELRSSMAEQGSI